MSISTTAEDDCQNDDDNLLENTITYDWRTISKRTQFDCQLPARKACNPELPSQIHVPLLPSTRDIVLRQARRGRVRTQSQKTNPQASARSNAVQISKELARALHYGTVPDCRLRDDALAQEFDTPLSVFTKARRGGQAKCCFNYLLLDPRVTKRLPNDLSASCSTPGMGFATFVGAIFYVGKGSRARPYQHFIQALEHLRCPRLKSNSKVKQILAVWNADCGVVSLHCFQSAAPLAALTREACIIDALELDVTKSTISATLTRENSPREGPRARSPVCSVCLKNHL
uniref:ankyrin repeat and LEM domain-containing protein 1 n=1 Tax=Myxine glutinosa TaxID=7769 RepID=UPI00358EFDA8